MLDKPALLDVVKAKKLRHVVVSRDREYFEDATVGKDGKIRC